MKYFMIAILTWASLLSHAEGEHFASVGPITALGQLESSHNLNMRPHLRPFDIRRWQTKAGTSVMFVRADDVPMLDMRVVFNAGAARDADQPGLAYTLSNMMFQGTEKQTAAEIAATFERMGAQFSSSSARDMALVELRTLTDPQYMDAVLQEFTLAATQPKFREEDFQRVRNQELVGLKQMLQSPGAQATKLFWSTLYAHSPYATLPQGDLPSLQQMKPADIEAFFRRYYNAHNAILVMVGAIDEAKARSISETFTASLPEGVAAPALPDQLPLAKAENVHLEFPSEQTHILMGGLGIRRDNPDYYALSVGNEILGGGGFSSWLTREIRVKRGYSYSVASYFIPMQATGPWMISMQTRNDQTQAALQVTHDVIDAFLKEGPTAAELQETKDQVVGGYPLSLASNYSILGNLAAMGFYHLPADFLEHYPDAIEAVTLAQVKDAMKRHVRQDTWVTVTVGLTTAKHDTPPQP
ncbi:MAG: insulinase family protein [Pseudomonadales bacterium]|nr:insulinase family protein [Pseudomonadales bacterium]